MEIKKTYEIIDGFTNLVSKSDILKLEVENIVENQMKEWISVDDIKKFLEEQDSSEKLFNILHTFNAQIIDRKKGDSN